MERGALMLWTMPAVVWVFVVTCGAPPRTLAEAAWHAALLRQWAPPVVRALTDRDVPRAEPPPPPAPPGPPAAGTPVTAVEPPPAGQPPPAAEAGSSGQGEAWWRARMAAARAAVDHDQLMADALQSRINALATDIVNRDDPYQRAELMKQRQLALDALEETKKQIDADKKHIAEIEDDARAKGIPAGWIR
jgi:hypothetical protein